MLRQFRVARAAQIALCAAAILAIGGSFGMHPEPGGATIPASPSGLSTVRIGAAPHGCVACLNHGAALASPLPGPLLAVAPAAPASLPIESVLAGRLAGRGLSGRSPPARS